MSLNASELTSMLATVTGALPEPVTVLRTTRTSDAQGGEVSNWSAAFSTLGRRDELAQIDEAVIAGTLESIAGYAVILPARTTVRQSDRLQFLDGMVLEIVGFHQTGPWELDRRTVCRLVGGS